jgi:NADPH2:quinone reductase
MRAVLCRDASGHDALTVEDVPAPALPPGGVRVAVHAAGLNFADTLMVAGQYQEKPELPFIPGLEAAGEVIEVAAGVVTCKPGDRVIATMEQGAFAEEAIADAGNIFIIPDSMGFETAAGFIVTYGTSHVGLARRANLQAGETLLVHGAAGGVGLTAVELGKIMGATVIATAGGPEKLEVARSRGADHLIDTRAADIRAEVRELTGGRGADVVFDPVGGDLFDASLRSLAWEGRLLVVGFASGRIPSASASYLLVKNCSVVGLFWGAYRKRNPAVIRDSAAELLRWFDQGKLRPHVSHRFDIAEAAEAMRTMLGRKSTGKVVLTTGRG